MELTQEDLKNILVLIGLAPIKGEQAMTVAILQKKINALKNKVEPKEVIEPKKEDEKKV